MAYKYMRAGAVPARLQLKAQQYRDMAALDLDIKPPVLDYAQPWDGASEIIYSSEQLLAGWTIQADHRRTRGIKLPPEVWINVPAVQRCADVEAELARVVSHEAAHVKQFYNGAWGFGQFATRGHEDEALAYERRFLQKFSRDLPPAKQPVSTTRSLPAPASSPLGSMARAQKTLACANVYPPARPNPWGAGRPWPQRVP
jgi:hypothetical protein